MSEEPTGGLRVRDLIEVTPPAHPPGGERPPGGLPPAGPPPPGPPPSGPPPQDGRPPAVPHVIVEAPKEESGGVPALPFDPALVLLGVRRRLPLIVGVTLVVLLLSFLLALAVRSHEWQVWVTILRKHEQKEFLVTSSSPIVKLQVYAMPTVLRLVKVNENLKRVIDELSLAVKPAELSSAITVQNPKDTDIIEILVLWNEPKQAVAIANLLARAFVENTDRLQKLEAIQGFEYLSVQLAQTHERILVLETELVAFKELHGVVRLSEQAGRLIQELAEFDALAEKERLDAEMERISAEKASAELGRQQGNVVASIYVKKPLHAHLVELQTQLAQALAVYTGETAKVKELSDEIARVEELLRQGIEEQLAESTLSRNPVLGTLEQALVDHTVEAAAKEARARGYAAVRDRLRQDLLRLPELESKLATMTQALDGLRQIEMVLAGRVEEVRIIRDSTASNFSIMQEARVPDFPVPSKAKLVLAGGLLLGVFLGFALALGRELADTTIKASREIERALGVKLLGEVPRLAPEQALIRSLDDAPSAVVEVYRHLLSRVLIERPADSPWVLLITSATAFEGRTTFTLNLARVAVARGLAVCVVEGETRKSGLAALAPALGRGAGGKGLAALLAGTATFEEALDRGGKGDPALLLRGDAAAITPEALGSVAMRDALAGLAERFDLVLVDGPPVLPTTDALLLAPAVGAVVYLVEAFAVPRAAHRQALDRLAATGAKVLGAILNKVPVEYAARFSVHGFHRQPGQGGHS